MFRLLQLDPLLVVVPEAVFPGLLRLIAIPMAAETLNLSASPRLVVVAVAVVTQPGGNREVLSD